MAAQRGKRHGPTMDAERSKPSSISNYLRTKIIAGGHFFWHLRGANVMTYIKCVHLHLEVQFRGTCSWYCMIYYMDINRNKFVQNNGLLRDREVSFP